MPANHPIFVISDLHLADGGARDNFAVRDREQQFGLFLDHVAARQAELIINGDLFEFWQASLSRVLVHRRALLDRLADMQAKYVVGNHDADLAAFITDTAVNTDFLVHPSFERMCGPFERTINDRKFRFMHGHEVDEANRGDVPGWGRIFAILAGIFEDAHRSPIFSTGQTVEGELEKLVEDFRNRFSDAMRGLWDWLAKQLGKESGALRWPDARDELTPAQNPSRAEEMMEKYEQHKEANGYHIAIVGHTHKPGRRGDWYFNSGSWTDDTAR
jgi:UDP-2,3-diacylglucosamine pyrophosphatase LpxH